MKHIIDIDAWERRDNDGFFRSFVNSWYSVTTEIDCTEASAAAPKGNGSNVKGLDISAKGTFTNSGWLKLSEVTVK